MPESERSRRSPTTAALRIIVTLTAAVAAGVAGANFALIARPVTQALKADGRNAGYVIRAHYGRYIDRSTLVLDLTRVDSAAPLDLYRGLFQAADTLTAAGRRFARVVLARNSTPVYVLDGDRFAEAGAAFDAGENPVYLVRTLPQHLRHPNGTPAFETWEGGLLGVAMRQMQDVTAAARTWVADST
jgi:hypothetical protein